MALYKCALIDPYITKTLHSYIFKKLNYKVCKQHDVQNYIGNYGSKKFSNTSILFEDQRLVSASTRLVICKKMSYWLSSKAKDQK